MSGEAIHIEITRDRRDYVSAAFANLFTGPSLLLAVAAGIVLMALIETAGALLVVKSVTLTSALGAGLLFMLFLAVVCFGVTWLSAFASWRLPGALSPIAYTFTPDAIEVRASAGESKLNWSNWRSAFENQRVLIIRHQLGHIYILPRRQIDVDAQARLKALLRAVLGARARFRATGEAT